MYYHDHAKGIKGLSIATLILSILSIAGFIVVIIFSATLWPAVDSYLQSGGYNDYAYSDGVYSFTPSQALGIGLGAFVGVMIWGLITSVVTLIPAIYGIRQAGQPNNYGPLTVWSVIGAIVAFFCGRIATMVLLIIVAVFSSQDRKAAMNPMYQNYGQAPYGQGYGQPGMPGYGQQPPYGQGYGTPVIGAPQVGAPQNAMPGSNATGQDAMPIANPPQQDAMPADSDPYRTNQ